MAMLFHSMTMIQIPKCDPAHQNHIQGNRSFETLDQHLQFDQNIVFVPAHRFLKSNSM